MRIGKQSLSFDSVYIQGTGVVTGPIEKKGPLGDFFDLSFENLHCNEDNWEKAECSLLKNAIDIALKKSNIAEHEIDFAYSGDLVNQDVISNYVYRYKNIPFFGIYGACSTSMEGMILGSICVDGNQANNVLCSTSSHNATAERQYRYPTEYGGQKPNTATFTVTGAGAVVLSNTRSELKVVRATVGRVIDASETNPFDMGSAMAPAASDTIIQHFKDFNLPSDYYDLVLTGDLSQVGRPVCDQILKKYGIELPAYNDCGLMVYDIGSQPVLAGGSGCACSAVVTYSYVLEQMKKGLINRVLICATGALMNPVMIQQKESIPAIGHAVAIERVVE